MQDVQRQLHSEGYAIVRGFFDADEMRQIGLETDRIYQEGLKHHATYRHKNLLLEVLEDPKARRRVVIQAHWTAWISSYLERMRRHPKYFGLLGPLLGPDIKQITQQTVENGALRVVPRSHLLGYLGLSEDQTLMTGQTPDEDLVRVGLDPASIVTCTMEPGDLLLWTLYTVHGSAPNVSTYDRRFMISSYVRASDSDRGEWTFRGGLSTPLGPEPEICKYEELREKPGPFYIEPDWTEEARAARA